MTEFDPTSYERAIKNVKQYKINRAQVMLIGRWPAKRSWNTNRESSQNRLGWMAPLQVT